MTKRTLGLGLLCAVSASVAIFTACSNTAVVTPQEAANSKAQAQASASADPDTKLAADATATVTETADGYILTSGDASLTNTGAAHSTSPASADPYETYSNDGTDPDEYSVRDQGDYMTVKLGSNSPAVEALQETLTDLGYLNGATGYFGTDTKTALEAFQEANHLTVDGIAGNSTWDVILAGNAVEA